MNAFNTAARRYGVWATVRQAINLGLSFEDIYLGFFNRLPRK